MFRFLLKLSLVVILGYLIFSYFFEEKEAEEAVVRTHVDRLITKADSLRKSEFFNERKKQMQDWQAELDSMTNSIRFNKDTLSRSFQEASETFEEHRTAINQKILQLDTVSQQNYLLLKNKIEVGIARLKEEAEKL